MQTDGKRLSVVVPVFNEEPTVGDIVRRLKKVLKEIGLRYEVIVVDDCSTDDSLKTAKKQGVSVYKLQRHLGKGYALRAGFAKAKGDWVATIDSDGSHLPEELPILVLPLEQGKADLVIGSRFLNNGKGTKSKINKAGNHIFNKIIRLLTARPISDSQSGYRVMTRTVLENMMLGSGGYEIESEMLVKSARKQFRIVEVPITYDQRTYGRSGIDPLRDGLKILASILWAYLRS